eukprot:7690273-Alexandrium_andersonii.AAC.1
MAPKGKRAPRQGRRAPAEPKPSQVEPSSPPGSALPESAFADSLTASPTLTEWCDQELDRLETPPPHEARSPTPLEQPSAAEPDQAEGGRARAGGGRAAPKTKRGRASSAPAVGPATDATGGPGLAGALAEPASGEPASAKKRQGRARPRLDSAAGPAPANPP